MLGSKDSSIDPKICGEFHWDAATAVDPKTNGAGSLQCLINLNPAVGPEEVRDLVALHGTDDVLKSFNRDTARLAAGILGSMVCAALVLAAALIQEGHPKEERRTGGKALMRAQGPRHNSPAQGARRAVFDWSPLATGIRPPTNPVAVI